MEGFGRRLRQPTADQESTETAVAPPKIKPEPPTQTRAIAMSTTIQETVEEERAVEMLARLKRIEAAIESLVRQRTFKDWYTTDEAAEILGRASWTVREWCRLGRVHASKRTCGRGRSKEWIISHEELARIQNEGLLPLARKY